MSQYYATVDGRQNLAAIQSAIAGEEALAARFIKSQLTVVDGKITNLLTFEEVDALPAGIHVLLHPSSKPAGTSPVWSGVMLVQGSNAVVDCYR
ncbi:MAG: hypothetical protein JWQ76_4942 [Ramlibacter sp.]|nr:hypothetical protein [Ramlibacter sp.]